MSKSEMEIMHMCENKNDKQIKYILLTQKFKEEIESKIETKLYTVFELSGIFLDKNIIEKGIKIEKEILKLEDDPETGIKENEKFIFSENYLKYKAEFFPKLRYINLFSKVFSIQKEIDEMF